MFIKTLTEGWQNGSVGKGGHHVELKTWFDAWNLCHGGGRGQALQQIHIQQHPIISQFRYPHEGPVPWEELGSPCRHCLRDSPGPDPPGPVSTLVQQDLIPQDWAQRGKETADRGVIV